MSKGKSRPPHIHDRLQLFSVMVEGEEQISERQFLKMKVGLVARVEDGGWDGSAIVVTTEESSCD